MSSPFLQFNAEGWGPLKKEFGKPYMRYLEAHLQSETRTIYPARENIFRAFEIRSLRDINVVIIGQDPYFKPNQATGLAFAVPVDEAVPDSLKRIDAEILRDTCQPRTQNSSLEAWARQGVLLLNSVLTVCEDDPKSHFNEGWEEFTDAAVRLVNAKRSDVVFCLWGEKAREKRPLIDCTRHYVLPPAGHPMDRGAGRPPFAGCAHFSQINRLLKAQGRREITW